MFTLLAADIVDRFMVLLWPMIRISALLMVAPVLSLDAITIRIRILFAFILTWLIYPLMDWPRLDPTTAQGLVEVFNQAAIGLLMGLMLQIVLAAVVVGGQTIASKMGLAMASLMDPNFGNVPVIAQLLLIMASLIFLGLGGHVLMLELLLQSFQLLPIGTGLLSIDAMGSLIAWSSMMFTGAVLLSLPILVVLLTVNIGLGVVTRAAPTLNIIAVGFPALILVGFLVFYASIDSISARIQWLWLGAFAQVRMILGVEEWLKMLTARNAAKSLLANACKRRVPRGRLLAQKSFLLQLSSSSCWPSSSFLAVGFFSSWLTYLALASCSISEPLTPLIYYR